MVVTVLMPELVPLSPAADVRGSKPSNEGELDGRRVSKGVEAELSGVMLRAGSN